MISAHGNEFTADDVIWRFDRERKRPIIYALISRLFNLDKAKYEKVDKYTVKLTNPDGAPLACQGLTNFYYPWLNSTEIKKHMTADDEYGDNWIATHAGGFGAYKVTEWTPGKRAVMEANEHYWRGACVPLPAPGGPQRRDRDRLPSSVCLDAHCRGCLHFHASHHEPEPQALSRPPRRALTTLPCAREYARYAG